MGKHDAIAEQLTQDILRGHYRPGERLPSERDLATRFDANRSSVREAMQKLAHLGIADIQPGGTRVVPLNEASLDIIEPILDLDEIPDRQLVDNIMQVLEGLVQVAVESTLVNASEEQLNRIREHSKPLYEEKLSQEQHAIARFTLMHSLMTESNNLVCQLLARSLLLRFAPRMEPLSQYLSIDMEAHGVYAKQLDAALASRDVEATRAVFAGLSKLNRETMARAYIEYEKNAKEKNTLEEVSS